MGALLESPVRGAAEARRLREVRFLKLQSGCIRKKKPLDGRKKCQGHRCVQRQAQRDDAHDQVCAGEECAGGIAGGLNYTPYMKEFR